MNARKNLLVTAAMAAKTERVCDIAAVRAASAMADAMALKDEYPEASASDAARASEMLLDIAAVRAAARAAVEAALEAASQPSEVEIQTAEDAAMASAIQDDTPARRIVPRGLEAAIQPSGALSIPNATGAALGWILRLGGAGSAWTDIRRHLGWPPVRHTIDAIVAAIEAAHGEDSAPPRLTVHWDGTPTGAVVLRWEGHWTPGRWASASFAPPVLDVRGVSVEPPVVVEWDEGSREPGSEGWSRWLDVPRAFGRLLAGALEVPHHEVSPVVSLLWVAPTAAASIDDDWG